VTIRPAAETEEPTIRALIRQAHLNRRSLHWQNFLVAEVDGRIVGLRQVKSHSQGTREVASGYVLPAYRHRGISARLMEEVLAREEGPLYLMCDAKWMAYYQQFGFALVGVRDLPGDLGREYSRGRLITTVLSVVARRRIQIIPMVRHQ
jgi:N-acetylglutamate synthase-like GNAT family acetyltransferase